MSFKRTGGRNAPIPHSLNRDSEFYGKYGMLKDGYSYEGGPGMVAMGEGLVGATRGAGPDGMVGGTERRIIYGTLPEQTESKETAPAPETEKVVETPPADVQLSGRAAGANAYSDAFEDIFMNRRGSYAINNDKSVEQDFKDKYQDNLTNELKAQSPTTLATKAAEYELSDKQAADVDDSFDLTLDSSSSGKNLQFT